MMDFSRLANRLGEYALIIAVVVLILWGMFAAVSSLPPEPTPESVEMGSLR